MQLLGLSPYILSVLNEILIINYINQYTNTKSNTLYNVSFLFDFISTVVYSFGFNKNINFLIMLLVIYAVSFDTICNKDYALFVVSQFISILYYENTSVYEYFISSIGRRYVIAYSQSDTSDFLK